MNHRTMVLISADVGRTMVLASIGMRAGYKDIQESNFLPFLPCFDLRICGCRSPRGRFAAAFLSDASPCSSIG